MRSKPGAAFRLRHWGEFEDVADHCTVCHRCENPCPVNIDFGDVTIAMRNLLRKMDKKTPNRGHETGDDLPEYARPVEHSDVQKSRDSSGAIRRKTGRTISQKPCAGHARANQRNLPHQLGRAPVREQVIHFINKPMPGNLPKKTARALLDIEDAKYVPIIRDPQTTTSLTPRPCSTSRGVAPSGCSRRSVWRRRPCSITPACRPCCHRVICAAVIRRRRRVTMTKPIKSPRITACCSTA
jgi:Fe-S oxidoreductase